MVRFGKKVIGNEKFYASKRNYKELGTMLMFIIWLS